MDDLAITAEGRRMRKSENVALSNTQVSEVIEVIFLGVLAIVLLITLRKSNSQYEELVTKLVSMRE